jgi:hypothetical protein
MTRVSKMIHFPKTRLAELAERHGGMTRSHALEEATKGVQGMLDVGLDMIRQAMAAIEATIYSAKQGRLDHAAMQGLLRQADQIVTMAATFAYATLEEASKSLCDVADGLVARGMTDAAPIIVHVQAMRLMIPGSANLAEGEVALILAELARVRDHYRFVRLSSGAPADLEPSEIVT